MCEDSALIGAPFYVMERRHGVVLDQELPDGWPASRELHAAITESLVRGLVDLHAVDWRAAGLDAIGRPDGYLQRQVAGWLERFSRVRTFEMSEVEPLTRWLEDNLPQSPAPTVIHNDYKLNNVLLDAGDPRRLSAVLDWEMATVGDPISDLAALLVYWTEPGEEEMLGGLKSVAADLDFSEAGSGGRAVRAAERPRSRRHRLVRGVRLFQARRDLPADLLSLAGGPDARRPLRGSSKRSRAKS